MLGVVATYHPVKEYVYSNDDRAILRAIASQAAIALDNSRMFYDINQKLKILVEFGRILAANIQKGEAIQTVVFQDSCQYMFKNSEKGKSADGWKRRYSGN